MTKHVNFSKFHIYLVKINLALEWDDIGTHTFPLMFKKTPDIVLCTHAFISNCILHQYWQGTGSHFFSSFCKTNNKLKMCILIPFWLIIMWDYNITYLILFPMKSETLHLNNQFHPLHKHKRSLLIFIFYYRNKNIDILECFPSQIQIHIMENVLSDSGK